MRSDALGLDAHLLVEPLLAAAQAAQEALLLQLARQNLLVGAGLDVLAAGDWSAVGIGDDVVLLFGVVFTAAVGAIGGNAGFEVFLVVGSVDNVRLVAVDEIHTGRIGESS